MADNQSRQPPRQSAQLVTSLPVIRRYSRANEQEDRRFRAFVKHELPMSNSELDPLVLTITRQVWSQIDCLACGNCCRTLQVIVDDADIARLSNRLNLRPSEFKARFVATATDGANSFAQSPCPFLGDDNACSVYQDRPQSCRDYPYLLTPGFRKRTIATLENVPTCPIVFNVWQSLKRQLFRMSPRSSQSKRKKL